ncbi:hypothetical protein Amsp01_017960 [Amycolatopsis sp. NBRC 101858]|uniref:hypothetical protein n=1 Tax=Amycolatopsis sp. NBRC 101858 TaxID=3032200 RepID=UPI0024A3C7DE|nr:hypothetical protein [Amycolatopsis sp. NBRC 101858]GLY35772.1 hypothetical protein Amsp01_017960 [Amycolatopsis sp. NBRC 101858]
MNVPTEKRTRLEQAMEWAVWHFGELAGVVGPLILAMVFTPWFALVTAVVAAGWAVHEVRDHREQTRLKPGERKQLPARPATTTDDTSARETREVTR